MVAVENAQHKSWPHGAALAWALGRLPLLLVVAFLLRGPIIDAVERVFDIIWVTEFAIKVMSTPASRIVLWLALTAVVTAAGVFLLRSATLRDYGAALFAGAVPLTAAAYFTDAGKIGAALALGVLAVNWAPLSLLARVGLTPPRLGALIAIPPGFGEGLFGARYLHWVSGLLRGAPQPQPELPMKVVGAGLAAFVVALLAEGAPLAPLERTLRAGGDSRIFASGDFNGLALDSAGARLFVTGHGVPHLLSYDARDLAAAPLAADVETGEAQALAYDPHRQEIYVFNYDAGAVIVLDAATLHQTRTLAAPDLSPGDPWIAIDPISNTVSLVSEADEQVGSPIIIYDRDSGEALARREDQAGNVLVHPDAPLLYLSFFRRERGVLALDLTTREVVASGPTDTRMERMAYNSRTDELYVVSPLEGRVLRFDSRSLEPRGAFPALFGVRVLALDSERGVMLAGSISTGKVAMLNLNSFEIERTWYVGPWLRSIVLDAARGVAFVSSKGHLYELRYAAEP